MIRKFSGRNTSAGAAYNQNLSADDLAWLRVGVPGRRARTVPLFRAVAVLGVGIGIIGLVWAVAPLRCAVAFGSALCPVEDVQQTEANEASGGTAATPVSPTPASAPTAMALPSTAPAAGVQLATATETTAAPAAIGNYVAEVPAFAQRIYAVSVSPLVVRSGPSSSDRRLFVLQPGEKVMLLEWGEEWKSISDDKGRTGWVLSALSTSNPLTIEALEAADEPAVEAKPAKSTVRTRAVRSSGVTVRSGPNVARAALFALDGGSRVTVLGEKDGWLRVRDARGRIGWAYSKYITR